MINFKDRKRETKELKKTLVDDKFAFEVIYGRRRVGKTALILNATKNLKTIYYLAVGENNLERFYKTCTVFDPEIKKLKIDYEIIIEYLSKKIDVLIIDEIQNLIKENSNFTNILQALIDTKLKDTKLKLFILGSSVSMITSKVLSHKSPLYGRRTASLKLKPVNFFDLKSFFPNTSFKELLFIYGFADGIPLYLNKINNSFFKWLDEEIKTEKGFIRDEVDFLMQYEFTDSSMYKLILEAISNGKTKLGDIKDYVKVQRTDLSPYLKNLIAVDFIRREIPITESQNSRNGRYYLKDNFLKFWFKFIYPNLSSIEQRTFDVNFIKKNYDSYMGFIFEDICKQYFALDKRFNFFKIGKWWRKGVEIDIVGLCENKMMFSECKYKENVDAQELSRQLENKIKFVDLKSNTQEFVFFAKSFKHKISKFKDKKVFCIDVDALKKYLI